MLYWIKTITYFFVLISLLDNMDKYAELGYDRTVIVLLLVTFSFFNIILIEMKGVRDV